MYIDKDNLNGTYDELQINQYWICKKYDEIVEDDHETIVILTEHQGLKRRFTFQVLQSLTEDIIINIAFETNWYAKKILRKNFFKK